MDEWGPDRLDDLTVLVSAAMPGEGLTADELLAVCWEDPGVVLATADGTGVVSAVVRRWGDPASGVHVVGYVKLLAVHPGARRQGIGHALLAAAEAWLRGQGAAEVHLGGAAPFYLWPGVDVRALPMLCLAEAAGYLESGAALNMSVPTTFRAAVDGDGDTGVEIVRVLEDDVVARLDDLLTPHWPEWVAEAHRAVEQGTCLAAVNVESGAVVGFACHSVNRTAWFGPTGTDPSHRHRGIGLALLGEVCRDLMVAGYTDTEICWLGPLGFYAAAGGSVSRVFQLRRKALGD